MRSHEAKERFRHARKLYVDRRFEEALVALDELKDIYDAYPDLHYLRARCLGKLKKADDLREVAHLLTDRFDDPRGAEILTWFVRRPVAETPAPEVKSDFPEPNVATPTGLVETPVEVEPVQPEVPDSGAGDATPEVLVFFDAPADSSQDDQTREVAELPGIAFEDAIPIPATNATVALPVAPPKRRALGRRATVAALAMVLAAGLGTVVTARVLNSPANTAPAPGSRDTSTAIAALNDSPPVLTPSLEIPLAPARSGLTAAVTFRPGDFGGYVIEPGEVGAAQDLGERLTDDDQVRSEPAQAWRIEIPFGFQFGGVQWDAVFVNRNGNLTFGYAEADAWPERETEKTSTPLGVVAAIDSRAAAGRERMIAPLWREAQATESVYARHVENELTITWASLDQNTSVTLRDDGAILFHYDNADTRHSFAGLFPGVAWAGEKLAYAVDPEDMDDPNVDIIAFQIDDAPTVVQFTMTMAAAVPTTVSSGELIHRITLDTPMGPRQFGVTITNEPRGWLDWGDSPRTLGYERDGEHLYFYLSKSLLRGFGEVTAHAEVVWKGYEGLYDRVDDPPVIDLRPAMTYIGEIDFTQPAEANLGSVYSLFDSTRNE